MPGRIFLSSSLLNDISFFFSSLCRFIFILEMAAPEGSVVIFHELIDYIKLHFRVEEGYFDEFNYEGAVEHKAAHRQLLSKIHEVNNEVDRIGKVESFKIVDIFEDWMIDHLYNADQKYVKCFHEHGLK